MPWEYQLSESIRDGIIWLIIIIAVITATRTGRTRKMPEELGRKVENFAGVINEANGPIPNFLLLLYAGVAIFWILYTINVVINGVKY